MQELGLDTTQAAWEQRADKYKESTDDELIRRMVEINSRSFVFFFLGGGISTEIQNSFPEQLGHGGV